MDFDIRRRIEETKTRIHQLLSTSAPVRNRISANQWIRHPAFCTQCGIPINPDEDICFLCQQPDYSLASIKTLSLRQQQPMFTTDVYSSFFLNNDDISSENEGEEQEEKITAALPALELLEYLAQGAQSTEEHERFALQEE